MAYSMYDFSESLDRLNVAEHKITRQAVAKAAAAWGYSPEGGGSWTGGFLLQLKDGRWAYLTGWCDYTGWGCQDGISCELFDMEPSRAALKVDEGQSWDEEPADLNRYLRGEIDKFFDGGLV